MKTLTEQVREIKDKLAENPNYFDDSNIYISAAGVEYFSELEKRFGKEDIEERSKPKTMWDRHEDGGYYD